MEESGRYDVDEPLISIIIPVYNVEYFLEDCLKSVLSQTYKNIEIIVVDDGSTDNSPQICDEYAKNDSRIKVVHQKNVGQGMARNSGIDIATGDYIGFVDSDDVILPQMYEILMNNILKYNADISACTRMQIKENIRLQDISVEIGNASKSKIQVFDGHSATKELLQYHKIFKNAVWEKLYRKELFENIRFRSIYAEDREVTYRLTYVSNTIVYIDLQLYCYRKRNGSSTNSSWSEHKNKIVHELDNGCIDYFNKRDEESLRQAAICKKFMGGIANYRIMEPIYRKQLNDELKPYSSCLFLAKTDYPFRRKIEFWIFARYPGFHYKVCNVVRFIKKLVEGKK
jgi:glycosyltransferase involved in cell wall biosynthesis